MIYDLTSDTFIFSGSLLGRNPVKLRQYDNRLWAVCDDGSIVFSNNGDAETWDALNVILLPNREAAIDFIPVQGGVIIPHRSGAYALYGSGTYQDTIILPIQQASVDPISLVDSAVVVSNVVYILGNRGVVAVSLNGIQELPHHQTPYLETLQPVWDSISGAVQAIYLRKFHAILYLFHGGYAQQGMLYYIKSGAVCKLNHSLPPALPYMTALDGKTDFLLATGDGTTICRSIYPAGVPLESRTSLIQTRHEDADSLREKIWRRLHISVSVPTYNVLISAFLDYSTTPTMLSEGCFDLHKGDNEIDLFDDGGGALRSHTISFLITIGGYQYLLNGTELIVSGDDPVVADEVPITPANFGIQEIKLQYREVGANR